MLGVVACACRSRRPDPAWVDVYEPEATSSGYNLILFERRTPMLIDMNGNEVHRWRLRANGRARLLPDGHLLALGTDGAVHELDWNGRTIWEFHVPGEDFAHHDVIALANGNRLVLAHDVAEHLDYLLEVDQAGKVVWEWRTRDHLAADLERTKSGWSDWDNQNRTHCNSIQELPPNRWHDAGDARFRPGNILLSVRNLDTLYILDRTTGDITWRYSQGLDHQHEASMIPRGHPGEGNIAVFNNGLRNRSGYRRSTVLEIDPVTEEVVWSYSAPNFYSSVAGTQQSLDNGNFFITSSHGGRLFEVTRDGRIVWQWAPPFLPMREHRYPYGYCPQLARLAPPRPRRVDGRDLQWISRDLYDFTADVPTRRARVDGRRRNLLADSSVCRELVLPRRPRLTVGYGFEPDDAREATVTVVATVSVRRLSPARLPGGAGGGEEELEPRTVFQRELGPGERAADSPAIEETTLDLDAYGDQTIELCFDASAPDDDPRSAGFFWSSPEIEAAAAPAADEERDLDAVERASREKQLRAQGYAD